MPSTQPDEDGYKLNFVVALPGCGRLSGSMNAIGSKNVYPKSQPKFPFLQKSLVYLKTTHNFINTHALHCPNGVSSIVCLWCISFFSHIQLAFRQVVYLSAGQGRGGGWNGAGEALQRTGLVGEVCSLIRIIFIREAENLFSL